MLLGEKNLSIEYLRNQTSAIPHQKRTGIRQTAIPWDSEEVENESPKTQCIRELRSVIFISHSYLLRIVAS